MVTERRKSRKIGEKMKISGISIYKPSAVNAENNPASIRNTHFHSIISKTQNPINDFPKSYIKIHPSFGQNYIGLSLEAQREIDRQNRIQQDKNDYLWAKSWNPQKAREEYDKQIEQEIEVRKKESLFYLKRSSKDEIRYNFNRKYNRELELYKTVMSNLSYYEKLFKDDIKILPRSLSEIMKNTKGTLDSQIAGYSALKRDMKAKFVIPVTEEMINGGEKEVANSILLCGPTGCGKTMAAEAAAKETYCYVDRIPTDTIVGNFEKILADKIREASIRYYQRQAELQRLKNSDEYKNMTPAQKDEAITKIGSPRTVVVIDEFDRYFNPLVCSEQIIKTNTDAVKTLFDGCAKLPSTDPQNQGGSAVTFLCTTNYPARIPLGDFNTKKVQVLGVFPPGGQDMQDVIRYYMNNANQLIREYQKTDSGLKEINTEEIKLDKFVQKFEPSQEQGAFSNDAIRDMVISAAESYIDNPNFDFNIYLLRVFKNSVRDIRPEKLQKYAEQMEKIHLSKEETEAKIDRNTMSEKEIIEKKIEKLTKYGEEFLMPEQIDELNSLREQLSEYES